MRKVIITILSIYLLFCLTVYFTQDYIIFQRGSLPVDYSYEIDEPYEEVYLGPGQLHHAVHIKKPNPQGIIIYFHGNRDSLRRWIRLTNNLTRYNYDLLLVEYPQYGKSKAELTPASLSELTSLIYEYASQSFKSDDIIIYGRSMGTGLASILAANEPSALVVLETPYYSLNDLLSRYLFLLPRDMLIEYEFNNYENLLNCAAPIYLLHVTDDKIIPLSMAEKLAATLGDKADLTIIEGGRHHDLSNYQEYWDSLDAIFLN